ncbi:unnamed protein product [Rotaria sp. Silwood2]|nr:unnamed protein product [Rotaria sp. Silwood2]CAF2978762.1 unnamed protein product [Rotaria sp. Silwood2]CAF3341999.1 unnamed protein product [Rotaria sp. Silwood2]CAF4373632.1 unnamed protein product [Rotaria sp. Silwood2]CAF4406106.1 unnamed protein product [Rotaria sp. Silwood2]
MLVPALISAERDGGQRGQQRRGQRDDGRNRGSDFGNRRSKCGDLFDQTFQIKIDFSSAYVFELILINEDGTVDIIDNTQEGVVIAQGFPNQGFTSGLGRWTCVGRNRIEIRSGGYNYANAAINASSTLFFNKYLLEFDNNCEHVHGTVKAVNYPLGAYPMDRSAQPIPGQTTESTNVQGRRFRYF